MIHNSVRPNLSNQMHTPEYMHGQCGVEINTYGRKKSVEDLNLLLLGRGRIITYQITLGIFQFLRWNRLLFHGKFRSATLFLSFIKYTGGLENGN